MTFGVIYQRDQSQMRYAGGTRYRVVAGALPITAGCKWLAVVGSGWQWLAVVGSGWQWLAVVGSGWQWLAVVGSG